MKRELADENYPPRRREDTALPAATVTPARTTTPPAIVSARGDLSDPRKDGAKNRRTHWLTECHEVHYIGRKKLQRPVHSGVTEKHRANGESDEDRELPRGLRQNSRVAECRRDQQSQRACGIREANIRPDSVSLAEVAADAVVDRCGYGGRNGENVPERSARPQRVGSLPVPESR